MMIPKAYWNQKRQKEKYEQSQSNKLEKNSFIWGQGQVPEYDCTLCGSKAWYIGLVEIYCSNKECKWYYNPHKENKNDSTSDSDHPTGSD